MLTFDKKIGLGEVIATFALVMSGVAVWQANTHSNPDFVVEQLTPLKVTFASGEADDKLYVGFPIIESNTGGRSASLLQIAASGEPTIFRIVEGSPFVDDPSLRLDYAIVEGVFNTTEQLAELISSQSLIELKLPQILNSEVESGKAKPFVFVLRISDRNGDTLVGERLAFSVHLRFSDGTVYRLAQGFGFEDS